MFLFFKGKPLEVITKQTPFPFTSIIRKENNLFVRISSCTKNELVQSNREEKIIDWLKAQARTCFEVSVKQLCETYGLHYEQIRVKDTKSRWGSCSIRKNLNFNWRLIMAPEKVLEYIVIHEISHLTELNHSSNFWKIVYDRCPDYKIRQNWLHKHGHKILTEIFYSGNPNQSVLGELLL